MARSFNSKKHIFITGGSEGLGLEFLKICIAKGEVRRLSLFSRSTDKLEAAKVELKGAYSSYSQTCEEKVPKDLPVEIFPGDASKEDDVNKAICEAKKRDVGVSRIDICVAAAGFSVPKYFEDLSAQEFERTMKVNYFGVVNLARAYLTETEDGKESSFASDSSLGEKHFLAVSSIAANVPFVGYSAYAPTKAAVRAFCDVLRNEFADVPHVHIHICFPPDMDTPGFLEEQKTKPIETKTVWPECFNELFKPQDVAAMMLDGIKRNRYHIHSPDLGGNALVSRAWGHYPRGFWGTIIEFVIASPFVFIHAAMVWMADGAVKKHKHHSKREKKEK
uniref:3-ketodihydrosphingosine reductase n=1 Tax=Ditylum brightwellii TaxID=49249 RepID=A0A7S4QDS2_9STRA